jgi:chemotaxis protein CheD
MLLETNIVTIYNGDYYVAADPNVTIFTLLGSCIAVCLYDEQSQLGGMNHFMLPRSGNNLNLNPGYYGWDSMEMMIDKFLKMGSPFSNLKAKVFGGARMFNVDDNGSTHDVARVNVEFTLNYLAQKRIPITARNLGGTAGRKIYFSLKDFSVYLQWLE